MGSEIEKMMQNANVANPVIKKWYYDGYYEDFSWQSSEEDCTKLLKYFDNSIDKLNDRIQQMKKEENTKYDRYTDSVDTEFGRIEKAYISYPPFTAEKQISLIQWLLDKTDLYLHRHKTDFTYSIASGSYAVNKYKDFKESIAEFINTLWQDLTGEEKQQVKGILE